MRIGCREVSVISDTERKCLTWSAGTQEKFLVISYPAHSFQPRAKSKISPSNEDLLNLRAHVETGNPLASDPLQKKRLESQKNKTFALRIHMRFLRLKLCNFMTWQVQKFSGAPSPPAMR